MRASQELTHRPRPLFIAPPESVADVESATDSQSASPGSSRTSAFAPASPICASPASLDPAIPPPLQLSPLRSPHSLVRSGDSGAPESSTASSSAPASPFCATPASLDPSPPPSPLQLASPRSPQASVRFVNSVNNSPTASVPPPLEQTPKRALSLSLSRRKRTEQRHRANTWDAIMSDSSLPAVPPALVSGVPMLKISSKKMKQVVMRLRDGAITWAGSSNSRVPIGSIRELRLGQPPNDAGFSSSRWITIVYVRGGKEWKILHMISLTDDVHEQWVQTLRTLVSQTSDRAVGDVTPADPDLIWIRQLWPQGAASIDMSTALGLCKSIGLEVPQGLQAECKPALGMDDFRELVKRAQTRPDLEAIMARLTVHGPLDRSHVDAFLRDTQRIQPGEIFAKYAREGVWTLESLANFLSSGDNSTVREMDMTRPLPEYFISSSHNTYLVGEQWRGESTVEGYIRVLLTGCRCVELDCHDGEREPEVYHKMTLTKPVTVRDICKAIDKYAFVASPYPVILSVETHCTLEQQVQLAQIMRECFGDKLVSAPIDSREALPSPEELRGRILFKTKAKVADQSASSNSTALRPVSTIDSSTTTDSEADSRLVKLARRISFSGSGSSLSSSDKSGQKSPKSPKHSFASELKELLVYTAGVKYNGFSKLNNYLPHHQFSVSDRTAERILRDDKWDWIKHNFTHLSRVYPKGARLMSSNYDPRPVWAAGNQLVALNWQTMDQGTILNHAMFADTSGYVLQPLALRQKTGETRKTFKLTIEVISAQRLPLSMDLYVEGQVDEEEQTTRVVKGTSISPHFDTRLEWHVETVPSMLDLTFVRLEIKSKAGVGVGGATTVAQWCAPIGRLRDKGQGYRYLRLWDRMLSPFVFATLFVRVSVDEI